MESTGSEKPLISHGSDSKWLSENLQGLDQLLKQLLEVMEGDGHSMAEKINSYNVSKPELIACLKELCNLPNGFSEHHHDLKSMSQTQVFREPGSEQEDRQFTPEQKSYSHESNPSPGSSSTSISFCGDGFKNGTDSPSPTSDSESEPFDHSIGNPLSINGLGQPQKNVDFTAETPNIVKENSWSTADLGMDMTMMMNKYGSYKDLSDRTINYEEDLILVKQKLLQSEEENSRLKSELERSKSVACDLQLQLEAAQIQLQNHISDSSQTCTMLNKELQLAREELEKSNNDKAKITLEFEMERNQVLELEKSILGYKAAITELDFVISNLRATLSEAQDNFFAEKDQLLLDLSGHLKRQKALESRITEGECKGKLLEEKLSRCENEKKALEELVGALESDKLCMTNNFHIAVAEKDERVEQLNKDLDKLRLECDMFIAEKHELKAQIQNLLAQVSCRDDGIRQVEENFRRSLKEHKELIAASANAQKTVEELRLRVDELEEEVDQQKTLLLDVAEKKREAIRQLCFSLDHYRTGYQELRQAFCGHKRNLVMAS